MSACSHTCPVHCTVEKAETKTEKKESRPYQVGDFIQVVNAAAGYNGRSGKITSIGKDRIFGPDIAMDCFFYASEIRLIAAVGT